MRRVVIATVTALALAGCGGGTASDDFSKSVQFSDCSLHPGGEVAVTATLTNTTDTTTDMYVEYEVATPDGSTRYGTNTMWATALGAGQTTEYHEQLPWSVTFTTEDIACKVLSVQYGSED